jgi:glycosyltransferase involved in cell wall biosynthesis
MKFSVLINNHNYGPYLQECVESVLCQTLTADEIIVVDDGSTDASLTILEKHFSRDSRVRIISQNNLGQTAAIARGIQAATGDIVCLLDADDRYKPEYLSTLDEHYRGHATSDLTFCRYEPFGEGPSRDNADIWLQPQKDYDYGYTALLTYFSPHHWIGNLTSTISLRVRLARTLNLEQLARDFYIQGQGDYPVLAGASLLGARKFYLHRTLTDYRLHPKNLSRMGDATAAARHKRWFNDRVRLNHFKSRSGISEDMFSHLRSEIESIPDPLPEHLEAYRLLQESRSQKLSVLRRFERSIRKARKTFLGPGATAK